MAGPLSWARDRQLDAVEHRRRAPAAGSVELPLGERPPPAGWRPARRARAALAIGKGRRLPITDVTEVDEHGRDLRQPHLKAREIGGLEQRSRSALARQLGERQRHADQMRSGRGTACRHRAARGLDDLALLLGDSRATPRSRWRFERLPQPHPCRPARAGTLSVLTKILPEIGDETARAHWSRPGRAGTSTSGMPSLARQRATACSGPAPPKANRMKSRGSWPRADRHHADGAGHVRVARAAAPPPRRRIDRQCRSGAAEPVGRTPRARPRGGGIGPRHASRRAGSSRPSTRLASVMVGSRPPRP